jgi:predicted ferric reductase
MLPLAAISLLAYGYRTLFGGFLVSRYTYVVTQVRRLDPSVTEIVMRPTEKVMRYAPGQFIYISFKDGGVSSETHPFSISSSPTEAELRITVKALGDFTTSIRDLNIGATAKIEGPFGSFSYLNARNLSQIWIAGGIGITPFLNMARTLQANAHTGHHIDFYYSAKTKNEMIFLEELERISATHPGLRVIPFDTDSNGYLTMDTVAKRIISWEGYFCLWSSGNDARDP